MTRQLNVLPALPFCPTCHIQANKKLGDIPNTINFAGRELDTPLKGGALYACRDCGLLFKYPKLSKSELDALYTDGKEDNWQPNSYGREDWRLANEWLERKDCHGSVLDIGCYDGRFLQMLDTLKWQYHGIEIHKTAAEKARFQGVQLIGSDFSALDNLVESFDVIVSFDVIEHVENPLAFLAQCATAVKPGGKIIFSTGNTSAWSWKLLGSRKPYVVCAEHMSFLNPQWCRYAEKQLGLTLKDLHLYRRGPADFKTCIKDISKNVIYRIFPNFVQWIRLKGLIKLNHPAMADHPPTWASAKDHFIAFFEKK